MPDRGEHYEHTGSALLDRLLGARVELLAGDEDADEAVARRVEALRVDG